MPRLVHLNGPPGIGKSTVARRYVGDHVLAFCLDVDDIRCLIGQWNDNEEESGRLARLMAVEMARTHLSGGHDVVIPQLVARPEFVRQLADVADDCKAIFHEIVLWAEKGDAEARFERRASDPDLATHHRDAARMIHQAGGFRAMYDRLRDVLAQLPDAIVLRTDGLDAEGTYRTLMSTLDADVPRGDVAVRYSDGCLTIRSLSVDDLEMDLAAKDDEQIDWMWEPGERQRWEAMDRGEQRLHVLRYLREAQDTFGRGPLWRFAVDTDSIRYIAYVDCNLANPHVPHGQANIAYSAHPAFRGRGYVSGGVRLALRFLAERTTANEAHILVDAENAASLRVARAVGAREVGRWRNEHGREMVRHVIEIRRGGRSDLSP
jgi:RimJ/RimL family protein N-acetyltransferase/predicted kinase